MITIPAPKRIEKMATILSSKSRLERPQDQRSAVRRGAAGKEGLSKSLMGRAKLRMFIAKMPRTATPRRMSREGMRSGVGMGAAAGGGRSGMGWGDVRGWETRHGGK